MRPLVALALLAVVAACRSPDGPEGPGGVVEWAPCVGRTAYVPTAGWRATCPGDVGLDTAGLRAAAAAVEAQTGDAYAFLVARHGYLVLETYWHGRGRRSGFELRSVTKMVTATTVGAAIDRGAIPSTADPVRHWYPAWIDGDPDARKQALTLDHLLDLTAGFDMNGVGWANADFAAEALTRPLAATPGTLWEYDEPLYHVLSMIVGRATGRSALALATERIFTPLGIPMSSRRWPVDPSGNPWGAGGLVLTAREMLTLGELYRRDGVWDGTRVLPDGWVRDHVMRREPGLNDADVVWIRGWRQTVASGHVMVVALGYGGQAIIVVPDLDLVVVGTADPYAPPASFPSFARVVRERVIPAVTQ